jgi:hypothetical protein
MVISILKILGKKDQADTVKLITNVYRRKKNIEVKVNNEGNPN